jgi:hypothetical protein
MAMLTAACEDEFHDANGDGEDDGAEFRGLIVSLSREVTDSLSAPTDSIADIVCGVTRGSGGYVVSEFGSAQELTAHVFEVDPDTYTVAVITNRSSAYVYDDEYERIALADSIDNPPHTYFGIASTEIADVGLTRLDVSLRSVLATLTVEITDVPMASTLDVMVANAASSVYPFTFNDATERYGVTDRVRRKTQLPSAAGDTLMTTVGTMMPTVAQEANSRLYITITSANGYNHTSYVVAPKMYAGFHYVISLAFDDLYTDLMLSSMHINDWTDGWVITGEVTEPIN